MPAIPIEVTSESESEQIHTGSTKKTYASKKRRATSASESDVQEVEKEVIEGPEDTAAEGDEDEDDEPEEEYEIEKILDAKKGHFHAGRTGYFVKWKGYGPEHNSWVDENDAGNAKLLIEAYWATKKKAGPRKSEPVKPKPKLVEKVGRKSLANLESSAEPEIIVKKRGRPKKQDMSSDRPDTRDDDDEERAKKKPRKSNGLDRKNKQQGQSDEDLATITVGNMKKHMKVPSWEDLVDTVDTVERIEDELFVFFTLKDKKRVRENSRLCAEKFPQKLIMFYESNLRWKIEESEVPAVDIDQ